MTTPTFPPGRYGRRREPRRSPRWAVPAIAGVVVLAGLAVAVGLYRQYSASVVRGQVTRYTVVSDAEIRVSFRVHNAAGRAATCVVRARAADGAEVGLARVPVAAGPASTEFTHRLPTTRRAVTGEVTRCVPRPAG
ncbi:MAG TPA: DUF4307 domain-containing protein [Cryptosporangiaceae bacterium]|nr:DUF4307 domain-containing protein [Cryptosporangiaceae bacterium]